MAELPKGVRLASGCFRPKGGVVTGRCFKQMGYRRIGLEILGLKMPLIEMLDLFARQLELQLDDNRPSYVFGFTMVTPMFIDEINIYTILISIKSYSICAIHASCQDRSVRLDGKPQVVLCRSTDCKPWGNTLREKLHEPCPCGIQIGALRTPRWLLEILEAFMTHTSYQP